MLLRLPLVARLGLALLVSTAFGFRAATAPPTFQATLKQAHMTFTAPAGWVKASVQANAHMDYDLAFRHPATGVEVRYAVRPLAGLLAEFARSQKAKGDLMVDPNTMYPMLFQTVVLNISQDDDAPVGEYPAEAVRREFNADWGATTMLVPRTGFGQLHSFCMVVALHRRNAADAYCFYLFENKARFRQFMNTPAFRAAFHALRFQPAAK